MVAPPDSLAVRSSRDLDPYTVLCQDIQSTLDGKVFYKESPAYSDALQSYFSIQEAALRPSCFIKPSSSQDVATIFAKINKARNDTEPDAIQFAVKSGGHQTWAGSANIDRDITVDLANLSNVDVSEDQPVTSIGPGARWSDVYSKLDAMNLSVVGGHAAQVGVGGLTLGGEFHLLHLSRWASIGY